jgi:hypothetical protein
MNDKMIFQVPGYIVKDRSLSGGGRQFTIDTQEALNPEHLQRLMTLENKLGYFTFSSEIIEAEDLLNLPKIDKSKYSECKSPSERLRSVIYLWHKKQCEEKGVLTEDEVKKTFQQFYDEIMEKFINHVKEKLHD